jgi:hypothetical protein
MASRNRYEPHFVEFGFIDPHRASNFFYQGQRLTPAEMALMSSKSATIHLMEGDL